MTRPPPPDVPALLRRLMADDPGRPRVTWYGPDGERVELSAKVLDNWVAKTANLLVDELDAGPGTRVGIALPPHWRTVTWLLATWSTGACAVLPGSEPGSEPGPEPGELLAGTLEDVDVLVAADVTLLAGAARGTAAAVAVTLPALAAGYGPDLPPGVLDAAAGVRSHGDVFVPFVRPVPADPALATPGGTVPHGDLLAAAERAAAEAGWADGVRLLTAGEPSRAVRDILGPLVRSGSVVLHHDLASAGADALAALRRQEAVTAG